MTPGFYRRADLSWRDAIRVDRVLTDWGDIVFAEIAQLAPSAAGWRVTLIEGRTVVPGMWVPMETPR